MAITNVTQLNKLNDFRLSTEGFLLSEAYLRKLQSMRAIPRYQALARTDAKNWALRQFFRISIGNDIYWANAVTGTLYNSEGICMSSSVLRLLEKPTPAVDTVHMPVMLAA
jgi:hypothetical protein